MDEITSDYSNYGPLKALAEEEARSVFGDRALVMVDPNCRPAVIPDRAAYRRALATTLRHAHVVKASARSPHRPGAPTIPVWLSHPLLLTTARNLQGSNSPSLQHQPHKDRKRDIKVKNICRRLSSRGGAHR